MALHIPGHVWHVLSLPSLLVGNPGKTNKLFYLLLCQGKQTYLQLIRDQAKLGSFFWSFNIALVKTILLVPQVPCPELGSMQAGNSWDIWARLCARSPKSNYLTPEYLLELLSYLDSLWNEKWPYCLFRFLFYFFCYSCGLSAFWYFKKKAVWSPILKKFVCLFLNLTLLKKCSITFLVL